MRVEGLEGGGERRARCQVLWLGTKVDRPCMAVGVFRSELGSPNIVGTAGKKGEGLSFLRPSHSTSLSWARSAQEALEEGRGGGFTAPRPQGFYPWAGWAAARLGPFTGVRRPRQGCASQRW